MAISVLEHPAGLDLRELFWDNEPVYQASNSEVLHGDHRIVERYGRREEIIVGAITSRRVVVRRIVRPDRSDIKSWHQPEIFHGYLTRAYIRSHTIAMLGNVLAE